MAIHIEQVIKSINRLLSMLVDELTLNNGAGYLDINTSSERFFIKVLNIIYDLNLVNVNLFKTNHPAIDLADKISKTSFQVTSQSDLKKIKTTIHKFKNNNLQKDYTKLKFLILSKSSIIAPIDKDIQIEVIDFTKLGKEISKLDDLKLASLHAYLVRELDYINVIESGSILPVLEKFNDGEINATNFFNYWKINNDKERSNYIKDLKALRKALSKLNKDQREFIYYVVWKSYSNNLGSSLLLCTQEVRGIPSYQDLIDSLVLRELLHDDKESTPMLVPHFLAPNSTDLDILYMVKFSANDANLREIMLNCDFSNV